MIPDQDGGPLILPATFPAMYLNGLNIPLQEVFEMPDGKRFSWVPIRDLRPFKFDDSECQSAHSFDAAEDFHAIRESMARAES